MEDNKTPSMVTELLKRAVAEKGQSGVARDTGLTQPAIHRYLKGIGEPSTRTLKKLAEYFGVSVAVLRGDSYYTDEFVNDINIKNDANYQKLDDLNKFVSRIMMGFIAVLNGSNKLSENIYFVDIERHRAEDALQLPENIRNDISPKILHEMDLLAKKVIEKYYEMLRRCDPDIREHLLASDQRKYDNRLQLIASGKE